MNHAPEYEPRSTILPRKPCHDFGSIIYVRSSQFFFSALHLVRDSLMIPSIINLDSACSGSAGSFSLFDASESVSGCHPSAISSYCLQTVGCTFSASETTLSQRIDLTTQTPPPGLLWVVVAVSLFAQPCAAPESVFSRQQELFDVSLCCRPTGVCDVASKGNLRV